MSARHEMRGVLQVVLAALLLAAVGASGQEDAGEEPGPVRKKDRNAERTARRDRGALDRRAMARTPAMPGGDAPVPMHVAGGKLYIVTGSTVRKLDAATLEEESTAVIPPPVDTEQESKAKERFMERFDKDEDGFVREDEVPNATLIRRLDKDGDGAVGISEAPSPRMATRRSTGAASLLVVEREGGADLYVFRGGWLFRYDTAELTLEARREVLSRQRRAMPEGPPGWQSKRESWQKLNKKRRKEKNAAVEGDRDPPPPPEPPDEPARF